MTPAAHAYSVADIAADKESVRQTLDLVEDFPYQTTEFVVSALAALERLAQPR